jgi:hypothetical protein
VIDLKVVFLLIFVLSGGESILSPDLCIQLCILSKSFVIFLCSSHAALQIQADLYKDCRCSEDTNHWVCASRHSVQWPKYPSQKQEGTEWKSPLLLYQKHLHLESHMQFACKWGR